MPADFGSYCAGCYFKGGEHLSEGDRQTRVKPLSMEDNRSSTLLVFQAPGVEEWASGRPISSTNPKSAGGKLASAFLRAGKTRADYDITNTVQCFPGKKMALAPSRPRDKTPPASVRKQCALWLRDDIESKQYTRVVVFGYLAKKAVEELGYGNDSRFRFLKHPTGGLSNAELQSAVA
jgi:uracil-DNA glycosylase